MSLFQGSLILNLFKKINGSSYSATDELFMPRISAALDVKACRISTALDVKPCRFSASLEAIPCRISAALDIIPWQIKLKKKNIFFISPFITAIAILENTIQFGKRFHGQHLNFIRNLSTNQNVRGVNVAKMKQLYYYYYYYY